MGLLGPCCVGGDTVRMLSTNFAQKYESGDRRVSCSLENICPLITSAQEDILVSHDCSRGDVISATALS